MNRYLLVAAGGAIGAAARYGLSGWVGEISGARFPWGTLAVNLLGCLLIGFFLTLGYERAAWSPELRTFVAVGILGGFTTFSTFSYETVSLLRQGSFYMGALSAAVSLFGCLLATLAGIIIARSL